MKNLLSVLALVLSFNITSCSNNTSPETEKDKSPDTTISVGNKVPDQPVNNVPVTGVDSMAGNSNGLGSTPDSAASSIKDTTKKMMKEKADNTKQVQKLKKDK